MFFYLQTLHCSSESVKKHLTLLLLLCVKLDLMQNTPYCLHVVLQVYYLLIWVTFPHIKTAIFRLTVCQSKHMQTAVILTVLLTDTFSKVNKFHKVNLLVFVLVYFRFLQKMFSSNRWSDGCFWLAAHAQLHVKLFVLHILNTHEKNNFSSTTWSEGGRQAQTSSAKRCSCISLNVISPACPGASSR